MKWKTPIGGAGCLPLGHACFAALTCTQACCHPRGFGWSPSLPGTGWELLGVDFLVLCNRVRPLPSVGPSGGPSAPVARVCCSVQQVGAMW